MRTVFNNPYPSAESPEGTASCVSYGVRYVEIVATGARGNIEVFGCVDPVSPIVVIIGRFQYIGFVFKRYESPGEIEREREREEDVHGKNCQRLNQILNHIYLLNFSRIQMLELHMKKIGHKSDPD